ncbi:MAG: hypothetical protein J6T60_01400 [Bacteroidales bacterium]|nr:hypothetical protein [Bacteroidales bacterium]
MKNILMLFLTIGLLVSAMSCDDKDDTIDYIRCTEIHYVNETGVSPILLDFYSQGQKKMSILFNNSDTTFVATENNDYGWIPPACHDSVIVTFGKIPSQTYSVYEYVESVKNPCRSECYEKETITNTKKRYTFTFTKDMLE